MTSADVAKVLAICDELIDIADADGNVDAEAAVDVLKAYLPPDTVKVVLDPSLSFEEIGKHLPDDPTAQAVYTGLISRVRRMKRKNV